MTARGVSLGVGFTNACDLACPHCYRPRDGVSHLTLDDVLACLDAFETGSVNLGTGENILNPHLPAVLDELARRQVRTSLTSNGLSLTELDDARLRRLHDVEVSLDFADPHELDAFRGDGVFDRAVHAIERCVDLGLKVTVLAVLMTLNHDRLVAVARLAGRLGATFRVNAYQPVHERRLMPTWTQVWEAYRRLFAETELVDCTEPVVVAALRGDRPAAPRADRGCGHTSVRVTPYRQILPCVYWPRPAASLDDLREHGAIAALDSPEFKDCRAVPRACVGCPLVGTCGGGCASRRALTVGTDERDPYCPLRDGELVNLEAVAGPDLELLHASNVCTTIVRAPP